MKSFNIQNNPIGVPRRWDIGVPRRWDKRPRRITTKPTGPHLPTIVKTIKKRHVIEKYIKTHIEEKMDGIKGDLGFQNLTTDIWNNAINSLISNALEMFEHSSRITVQDLDRCSFHELIKYAIYAEFGDQPPRKSIQPKNVRIGLINSNKAKELLKDDDVK